MKKITKKLAFLMAIFVMTSAFTTVSIVSSENDFQLTTDDISDCIDPELGRTGLLPPDNMEERIPYPYERSNGGLVYILIQDDLYTSITDSVYNLVDNIENRRNVPYTVEIVNGTWTDHPQVRRALQDGHDEGLVGAILIGDIPVSWYYKDGFGDETFPIDLYYMDLDGEWGGGDGTQHNPYTTHTDENGDVEPEIWVGRLYTDSLGSLGSSEELLEGYIDRVDDYSRGVLTREEKALVFVDNDWYDWADEWDENVGLLYENRTFVKEYRDTNADNYLNNLTIDYEWVSLFAHSNPRLHVFYPEEGGSNTYAYNTDISGTQPRALFYNLFCCSGTEYTYSSNNGYIAGHYLFAPSVSGLVAVGSTKTGSMLQFQDFYHPLSQGAGIGEAFRHWHVLNGQSSRDWFYGMNILGDPTLETGGYDWGDEQTTFDIPLDAGGEGDGWNFVSFNLIPLNTSLTTILDDITYGIPGNYGEVMYYDASVDRWYTYISGREDKYNNLEHWDQSMGIWIRMTSSDTLTVAGTRPGDTSLELSPEWNLVGVPSETAGNHGIPEEVTKVGYFDRSMDYNLAYDHNPGTFVFEPGKGYWIYNSADYMIYWNIDY